MMKMHVFRQHFCNGSWRFLFLICCLLGLFCIPVTAADVSFEAEFGDVINLHGVSYTGNTIYLFMTGPGLPANGVTLTDVSQRADQGKFTQVDVNSDQEWSMKWYTHRIENEIDPGTYIVYASTEPVDKSNLGGSSTYQTLEVYFKKSTTQRVSGGSGTTYTLNPEEHTSVMMPAIVGTTSTPTPEPTTELPTPAQTPEPTTLPAPVPTTKAPIPPAIVLLALTFGAGLISLRH